MSKRNNTSHTTHQHLTWKYKTGFRCYGAIDERLAKLRALEISQGWSSQTRLFHRINCHHHFIRTAICNMNYILHKMCFSFMVMIEHTRQSIWSNIICGITPTINSRIFMDYGRSTQLPITAVSVIMNRAQYLIWITKRNSTAPIINQNNYNTFNITATKLHHCLENLKSIKCKKKQFNHTPPVISWNH